jgi:GTPase SAR1 family protein
LAIGKILFFGQAGAGKTSIYKKYFLELSNEQILETRPTVLFTLTKPNIKIFEKEAQLVVFDLGGQSSYISSHLANDAVFAALDIGIFVIDVSEAELFERAIDFLSKAHERIQELNEKPPIIAIFLHKFDPARKSSLESFAEQITDKLRKSFPNLSENIYSTTLFDDSIKETMDTLLIKAFSK